jgi:hypothetical protein
LLYTFLVLVADRNGLSYYSFDKICALLQLSLDELKVLPAHEAYVTFACISNEIGGKLIGNARWKGVPLRTLLEMAQLKPEARKVVLRSDDGYSTGIPLERCLRPQTFLAYEMNGQELPNSHGFPLRAVIPGYYGMKQPKWLTEIEVVADDYLGYWEERGWADEAVVKTLSRIDVPAHRAQVPVRGHPHPLHPTSPQRVSRATPREAVPHDLDPAAVGRDGAQLGAAGRPGEHDVGEGVLAHGRNVAAATVRASRTAATS